MNISYCKEEAKRLLKGNWLMGFAVVLIYSLISGLVSSVTAGIGVFILSVSLFIAVNNVFISAYNGKGYELQHMVKGYDKGIGNRIALSALKNIYIFLWSLLFIIPGIVKSYSYALAEYISRENPEKTATECLDESRQIMEGHKMDLFLFDLSFIGWELLTVFTCGILSIYVLPYKYQARIIFIDKNIFKLVEIEDEVKVKETINAEFKEKANYCPKCGTKVENGNNFCPNCGNKI